MDFYQQLCEILGEGRIKCQEPMKEHTTFRVGGPADYFVMPKTAEQTGKVIQACKQKKVPYFILGNGSNLLISDAGYRGVVIHLGEAWTEVRREETTVWAGAGVRLSRLADYLAECSLSGFEFAAGIPGTLGGAVAMNAGAYGGELCQVIDSVKVVDSEGEIRVFTCGEMDFGYRTSRVLKEHGLILEVCLKLVPGREEEVREKIADLNGRRREKQPLEYPSAGSTFKRPPGYFAGKLIQDAGLAGFSVGDAQISEKHCGFVINKGDATAKDILALYKEVQRRVKEQFGVALELEVKLVGEFGDT